jgi:hypothetical protein
MTIGQKSFILLKGCRGRYEGNAGRKSIIFRGIAYIASSFTMFFAGFGFSNRRCTASWNTRIPLGFARGTIRN